MSPTLRSILWIGLITANGALSSFAAEPDFETEIAPIFRAHCVKCHGATKQQGGLRFDTRKGALRAGDSGDAAIRPGKSADSELIRRITSDDDALRMPPEGARLTAAEVDRLKRWIDAGGKWPESAAPPETRGELVVTDDDRQHWSFRPLRAPAVPTASPAPNIRTDIDRFIITRLEAEGLRLTKPALPRTLVRRISFDLTGLPPPPRDVAEFEAAFEKNADVAVAALIDRLLDSRHYGERWGRHWLDVARYADSEGQEGDQDRPFAFQYRDFVIQALNEDLPFDTFVRWQIAGDELDPENPKAVAATGFLTAGPHTVLADTFLEEERLRNRYNELDDVIATLGSGMLGLTLGCARCHDHKYDPVPTRDYYRLLAAFHSGERHEALLGTRAEIAAYEAAHRDWQNRLKQTEVKLKDWLAEQWRPVEAELRAEKIASLPISEDEKKLLRDEPGSDAAKKLAKKHEKALAISDQDLRSRFSDEQRRRWNALRGDVEKAKRAEPEPLPRALAYHDTTAEPKPTWLFGRADFYDKSQPVELGFLTVLTSAKAPDAYWQEARAEHHPAKSTYQRAALAHWITDVEHGAGALLARVIVNRVWQHHFRTGLVGTPSDFGVQGEKPTHPELLEWLAHDFVTHGWKLKRLHRQIVLSAVYRQDTTHDEAMARIDPENRLLWRRRPVRLEAEILRDAMLAVAGRLNLEPYGPAFKPPIAAEAMVARNLKTPYNPEPADSPNIRRRSVYMFHKRVVPNPLLQAFDKPDALQSCGRRDTTTVAPQALAILNDPFVRSQAIVFADRLIQESGKDRQESVRHAFELAFSRPPSDSEQAAAGQFLETQQKNRTERDSNLSNSEARRAALADFCQVLFGLNEFLYVD